MAVKGLISFWWLPVISGLTWLGLLLGLLLHWIIGTHRRHYPSMSDGQTIAYISDVGAGKLKPLFIAASAVTTISLDLSFLAARYLRHNGRLVPNVSVGEKVLDILSIVFAIIGTAGLILLSIFDTRHHHDLHDIFLLFFIAGYLISAVFICWEYQRLGIKHRQHRVLRASFWLKLTFILVELVLAIVFASTSFTHHYNLAAIFEWIVAFVFTFYAISFLLDLLPAVHTKNHDNRFSMSEMREALAEEGITNNHGNSNGNANGRQTPTHF